MVVMTYNCLRMVGGEMFTVFHLHVSVFLFINIKDRVLLSEFFLEVILYF